ncbi:MAG: hypothetical protein M3447_08830 [Acidobacteriota bacterium]|nr:hypothetical protein [Acidobacteriota bacterium]
MNKTTRLLCGIALAVFVLGNAVLVNAQEKQAGAARARVEHDLIIQGPIGPLPPPHGDFVFISNEMRYDGKRVTGAPYSAQAVTESTQTLSDGNRIVRKSTATLYRDGEGRTRREQTLKAIGPLSADGDPAQTVFISDPVAGVDYSLNTRNQTARKMMPMRFKFEMKTPSPSGDKPAVMFERKLDRIQIERAEIDRKITGGPVVMEWHSAREAKAKQESLGKQVIEGLEAEGTRSTLTIPAGEIGNERAIEIVSERWYSPELQTVVMTRHNDPRFGETTYKLTNIIRSEPDRSLFEVPSGYTLKEETMKPRVRMKKPSSDQ